MVTAVYAENTPTISLTANLEPTLYTDTKYTALFKIEIKNKSPCSPKDSVTVFYNISKDNALIQEDSFSKEMGCTTSASTGEFTPSEPGNYTLCGLITNSSISSIPTTPSCMEFMVIGTAELACDINLQLEFENQYLFYEEGQSIQFKPTVSDKEFPFVIEYWIEDLFGDLVKPKVNTTNTNQKTWKTNIEEQDRVLFLKTIVYPSCNDADLSDNIAEQMFIVTNSQSSTENLEEQNDDGETGSETSKNAAIEILKISPGNVSFGEILEAEIEIYKNDTDKYSISVWAEKDGKIISEKSKIHLKTKNTAYKLVIPVLLDANCNNKNTDGTAKLVVEGLSLEEKKEFSVKGINEQLCPKETETKSSTESTSTKTENSAEIIDLPGEIESGEALRVIVEFTATEDADFEAWSYLYRGSKCYSCASGAEKRDQNIISFSVDEDKTKSVNLLVKTDKDMEEGEYNFMFKYKKEGQKTEKSLSEKIYVTKVKGQVHTDNQSLMLLSQAADSESPITEKKEEIDQAELSDYKGIVVYESTSEKSKNLISWVLFVAFGLLSLILIIKKRFD